MLASASFAMKQYLSFESDPEYATALIEIFKIVCQYKNEGDACQRESIKAHKRKGQVTGKREKSLPSAPACASRENEQGISVNTLFN